MVVCGDNALAHRLVTELATVYGEEVTVVLPSVRHRHGPQIAALARRSEVSVSVVEATEPDDGALLEAGVEGAAALALALGDDQANIHAALRARRLNPELRLVVRLFNRKLGRHLEALLQRASAVRAPGLDARAIDASTTVLSDADTAAHSLAAAAVTGTTKIVQADGLMLRAADRTAGERDSRGALCTLALQAATDDDEPQLLPDDETLARTHSAHPAVVLEALSSGTERASPAVPRLIGSLPLGSFFSRRLRLASAGLTALVALLAVLTWLVTGYDLLHATYLSLLDVFAIGDPAVDESSGRQVLQLLAGFAGMLMLPLLFAVVLESYGAFRAASAVRRPPRGLSGHVVLLGLGKVGTRVLDRLCELDIPVVCVERDQGARGVALARSRRVPVVIGDVTEEGVLEAAKIRRSRVMLALTSSDSTNLEAVLYAREIRPDLRVVLRLYDDEFSTTVYRTLRDSYPGALTRSRSVSALAGPSFAGAMMGRQILGAIPVQRRVLLFAAVEVGGHPELAGRTVAEAFRPGAWRVMALDVAAPEDRSPDLSLPLRVGEAGRPAELEWDLHPGYVLRPEDRVVIAATRHGLGHLLQRAAGSAADAGRGRGSGDGQDGVPARAPDRNPGPASDPGGPRDMDRDRDTNRDLGRDTERERDSDRDLGRDTERERDSDRDPEAR
ncbi:NAD-binding protein [Streptomyces sp. 8N616]|uniref:NAD-binding protein n=1 Tax=Streptomyces sp. 8N616 TaxID=3457414 RepID=UPI003FD60C4F